MSMVVSPRAARACCKYDHGEYGHSTNAAAKVRFRRMLKRRERAGWKKFLKTNNL